MQRVARSKVVEGFGVLEKERIERRRKKRRNQLHTTIGRSVLGQRFVSRAATEHRTFTRPKRALLNCLLSVINRMSFQIVRLS